MTHNIPVEGSWRPTTPLVICYIMRVVGNILFFFLFRTLPTPPNSSQFAKRGPMSRMVTTVPPKNPFNKIENEPVLVA